MMENFLETKNQRKSLDGLKRNVEFIRNKNIFI